VREYSWREKKESHEDNTNEGFNPFSFSLTFGNPIRATRGISGTC